MVQNVGNGPPSQGNNHYPPDATAQNIINILIKPYLTAGDILEIQRLAHKLNQGSFGTAGDTIGPVSRIQSLIASLDAGDINYKELADIQGAFLGASYIDSGHQDNPGVYFLTTIIAAAHDYTQTTPTQQQNLLALLENTSSQLKQLGKLNPEELQQLNEQIQGLPSTATSLGELASTLREKYFS